LGVPFGLNVESVSIRKVEIEASVRLAARIRSGKRSGVCEKPPNERPRY
jgi:hypothetical protein